VCARLLGKTAVASMIVGRMTLEKEVVFDGGDEILVEDEDDVPQEIIVADHAGTFRDCDADLELFAADYARPVNRRLAYVPDAARFSRIYTEAVVEQFLRVQSEYRKRRRAFDTLFKHRRQDVGGFAWRWKNVLVRLDRTDAVALGKRIAEHIQPPPAPTQSA
jgi:hypothetical protein